METPELEQMEDTQGAGGAGQEAPAQHAHHWVIDEAAGPESHGVCRSCRAEREFRNWLMETDFVTRGERLYAA